MKNFVAALLAVASVSARSHSDLQNLLRRKEDPCETYTHTVTDEKTCYTYAKTLAARNLWSNYDKCMEDCCVDRAICGIVPDVELTIDQATCPGNQLYDWCLHTNTKFTGVDHGAVVECLKGTCDKVATTICPTNVDASKCYGLSDGFNFNIGAYSQCIEDTCAIPWGVVEKWDLPINAGSEPLVIAEGGPYDGLIVYPLSPFEKPCPADFQPSPIATESCSPDYSRLSTCQVFAMDSAELLDLFVEVDCDAYYWCVRETCPTADNATWYI